jgi:hypothetical protein
MEKDRGENTLKISFTGHARLVKKLLNSGEITRERARNTMAALAIEDLLCLERGITVEGASLAVDFLAKNWHRLPEEIKIRRNPLQQQNQANQAQRSTE